MAKAYASEAAVNCANLAIQVYGGAGFNEETGMPKLARDARIYTICMCSLGQADDRRGDVADPALDHFPPLELTLSCLAYPTGFITT